MRYTVRRISLRSALKLGLLLGWVVTLLPALALAALAVLGLRAADDAFGQVQTYEISLLGQSIASIDVLALLGLNDQAARVADLAAQGWGLFAALALFLALLGGAMVAVTAVLFSLCYNLLAGAIGGVVVELREAAPRPASER
jgi:uncharacterized membrane protein SpoIIM required for sporulation